MTSAELENLDPFHPDRLRIDQNFPALNEADIPQGPADQVAEFRTLMEEFVDLELRKREKEADLEMISDRFKTVEPQLREQMAALGMQNARCRGLTVYVKRDRYVSKKSEADGVTTERLIEVLRECGLGYIVREAYQANSLKAKLVEWLTEGVEVPEQLAACLNVGESVRLATRK
jgi:hypothetical protein